MQAKFENEHCKQGNLEPENIHMTLPLKECIALGIGNPWIGDDRAGVEVVRRLSKMGLFVGISELYTMGTEIMDRLLGYQRAFVVDACHLGAEPGTVHRPCLEDILIRHALPSSHAINLGTTLKTGYKLFPEEMPRELNILLIEVRSCGGFSKTLSPAAEKGVQKAVQIIASELKKGPGQTW